MPAPTGAHMTIRLSNTPIPEAHVVALLVGGILQVIVPIRMFGLRWIGHALGWPLVILGVVLASWAIAAAGTLSVGSPDALVTAGPYAHSRNPMYVAWALFHLGVSFVANSVWIIGVLVPVLIYVHYVDVRREERFLSEKFGAEYSSYKQNARRYL